MAFVGSVPLAVRRSQARSTTCVRPARTCCARRATRMSADGDDSLSLDALNKLRKTSEPSTQPGATESVQPVEGVQVEDDKSEQEKEMDRLRAAEKFITVDEGRFECPACSYVYEPSKGEKLAGIAPGTAFVDLRDTYFCPVCRTPKSRFVPKKKVIAGFADNQSYGIGANSMTAGQKNLLIFGGLVFAFLLLLSGYALN